MLILGANGSGKTTISKLILGHLIPSTGEIIINDDLYQNYTLKYLRKKNSHSKSANIFI
ncbi:MAG: hypothetical protein CR988_07225 [Treponema sp.]|nr:MAG: hypothetical protein CR988_07225 [Treponema sp.]